jgi:hypothetical protein
VRGRQMLMIHDSVRRWWSNNVNFRIKSSNLEAFMNFKVYYFFLFFVIFIFSTSTSKELIAKYK